jgi:hypothetical protein
VRDLLIVSGSSLKIEWSLLDANGTLHSGQTMMMLLTSDHDSFLVSMISYFLRTNAHEIVFKNPTGSNSLAPRSTPERVCRAAFGHP